MESDDEPSRLEEDTKTGVNGQRYTGENMQQMKTTEYAEGMIM